MTGKTHLAAGALAGFALIRPQGGLNADTAAQLILCMAAASVGALIPDVDSKRSKARAKLFTAAAIVVSAFIIAFGAKIFFGVDVFALAMQNSAVVRTVPGAAMFAAAAIYGANTKHRTFTHSLLGLAVFTVSAALISLKAAPYFFAAMLSHILLDLLNRKKVALLYPSKRAFALDLCDSDGIVNDIVFSFGMVGCILYLAKVII